jgi:preprotein translocase subunit YajC
MHSLSFILFALMPSGDGGDAAGGFLSGIAPLLIVFGIFYFLVIRPQNQQRKQHEVMLQNIKKGDKIITTGGLHGTVAGLTGDVLKVKIADTVSVQISRSAVATKLGDDKDKDKE